MIFRLSFNRLWLLVGTILGLSLLGDADLQVQDIEKAQKTFTAISGVVEKFLTEAGASDTLGYLNDLSKHLAFLGPVSMGISAGLSLINMAVSIYSGKEVKEMESPEMKMLRDGFDAMESELRVVSNGIEDLKVIVEKSSARSAYTEAVHTIENLYQEWLLIQQDVETVLNDGTNSKRDKIEKDIAFFKQQYVSNYKYAAKNLWEVFAAPEGKSLLKFDLLDLYRRDSNCNAMHVRQVCIVAQQLINKGMMVEAAFAGYENNPSRVESLQNSWKIRMQNLTSRCDKFVDECVANWQEYASRDIERILYEDYRLSKETLASKILDRLSEFIQNRSFLVILHKYIKSSDSDESESFSPAEVSYFSIKNVKKMDVHVFSKPLAPPPNFDRLQLDLNKLILEKTCFPLDITTRLTKVLIDKISSLHNNFALYLVKASKEPEVVATKNHFTIKKIEAGCFNTKFEYYAYS